MIRKKKNGISLVEFIIVITIAVMVITMSYHAFVFLNKGYRVLMVYLNVYLRGRETIDFISKDCRIAIRVMDQYAGYTTTDSSLVLKVPSLDASGNILDINNEFDYIIYRIDNDDLWKTVIPGINSSRPAYNDVFKESMESLYITCDGTPLSDIEHKSTITRFTLRASVVDTMLGEEYKITPGTTVKLMNYEWEFVR